MKKLIYLFIIYYGFTSCMTTGRIERHCDDFAKICLTETVVETEYRDTTLYVEVPVYIDKVIEVPVPGFKDSVRIRDSVRIINNLAYMDPVHEEFGNIGVDAEVYRSELLVKGYYLDSTINYHYKDTLTHGDSIRIANAIRDKTTTNNIVLPPERYVPRFYKKLLWFNIILAIAAVIFILIKAKVVNITKLIDPILRINKR